MRVSSKYRTYIFAGNLLSCLTGVVWGAFMFVDSLDGLDLFELIFGGVALFIVSAITLIVIKKSEEK